MVMPYSSDALSNILRLQGLKNVPRKKTVLPGLVDDLYDEESPDVQGASIPVPEMPKNLPEPELGGELTSQSYDVRANSSVPMQPKEDSWTRIGRWLGDPYYNQPHEEEKARLYQGRGVGMDNTAQPLVTQTPPIETQQVEEQEGLPPVSASEQESGGLQRPEVSPGVFGALADYFNPAKIEENLDYHDDLRKQSIQQAQGLNPQEERQKEHQRIMQKVQDAAEKPWESSVYGANDLVANSPELRQDFDTITGIKYDDEINRQVRDVEEAMKGTEEALSGQQSQLSAQAQAIQERILSNQATDADKFYIGLALLMPLLVGGLFGKEAGLGALGGAAQGISSIYERRGKEGREDEAALLDISKQQAANEKQLGDFKIEKAKLPENLRKLLPKDPNEHLINKKLFHMIDPATGKKINEGIQIKPGLVASPDMVTDKEDLKDIRKLANEINEDRAYLDKLNRSTANIIKITSQLAEKGYLKQFFDNYVLGKKPELMAKFGPEVDLNGKKINAAVRLAHEIEIVIDGYRKMQNIRGFGPQILEHVDNIISSPIGAFQSPDDTIDQVMNLRNMGRDALLEKARRAGFLSEYLVPELTKEDKELYKGLNRKEDKKVINEIKKDLI